MEAIRNFFSGEIVVDRSSWHCRLYHWWEQETGGNPYQENLCHYVRVVLLWAPLRWLLSLIKAGFCFAFEPMRQMTPEWITLFCFGIPIVGLAVVIAVMIYVVNNLFGVALGVLIACLLYGVYCLIKTFTLTGWRVVRKTTSVRKGSSILKIIIHAALAEKRKICPFIRFRND